MRRQCLLVDGKVADRQRRVDTWFSAHALVWDEIYRDSAVGALVYQRRQKLALRWVDLLQLEPSARVLEIGCGAGHAAVALAQKGLVVTATDTVPRMLGLARARARTKGVDHRLQFAYGDAHALAFGNDTFQLVVALGVIPWLHSPALALREIARVLRPGGFLIVSADNRLRLTYLLDPRLTPALAGARRTAARLLRAASRDADGPPTMHTPREFDSVLASSGFEKVAGVTCGFGPFTILGRQISAGRAAASLDRALQRLAAAGLPGIRNGGNQYIVLGHAWTLAVGKPLHSG